MMTLPDVLPSGQTGWELSLQQRNHVRKFYRVCRLSGIPRQAAGRLTGFMVQTYYPEAIY